MNQASGNQQVTIGTQECSTNFRLMLVTSPFAIGNIQPTSSDQIPEFPLPLYDGGQIHPSSMDTTQGRIGGFPDIMS
jgi:hypothetical protein